MKRKSMLKTMFTAILTAAALTACGSSGGTSSTAGAAAYDTVASNSQASYDSGGGYMFSNESGVFDEEMAEAEMQAAMPEEYDIVEDAGSGAVKAQQDALADRKLIKTVNMDVETEEFDILVPALEQRVMALGGYIEDMSSYNRNNYYSDDYIGTKHLRYASMTIRIPKSNLDTFLTAVAEQSNVVSRSESVTDVTLQYVDLESHKKALVAEQDRLLELMEQAETVEDIITIEGRLSEVRYQIESMESQLRTYDNKIDYSTIYLSIDEVEQYTPTEETTVGQRIANGFMNSLRGVGRGISNFAIWFVINIPYLVVWVVAIVVIFLIVGAVRKAVVKKHVKRGVQKVNPYQTQSTGLSGPYALTGMQQDAQIPQELQQSSADDKKPENSNKES